MDKTPRYLLPLIVLVLFIICWFSPASAYYAPLQDVVAWIDGKTVHLKVFDPRFGVWAERTQTYKVTPFNLQSKAGIVAWSVSKSSAMAPQGYGAVYDPVRESWIISNALGWNITETIINDGVVLFINSAGNTKYVVTYDPVEGLWKDYPGGGKLTRAGVVVGVSKCGADSCGGVYFRIYDPNLHSWVGGYAGYEVFDQTLLGSLDIDNAGTVSWIYNGQNFRRGYDPHNHVWYDGPALPLAYFAAPAWAGAGACFTDMSLGATSWHMELGDGNSNDLRSQLYTYTNESTYTVTQTVTGPGGSNTTTRDVIVEKDPPTGGTIVINNGSNLINNRNVVLSLSASDGESGMGFMRFSDDGTIWGNWTAYQTTYNYTLPLGDGTKTVYVQFQDVAGNISSTYSDSIILDTIAPSPRFIRINAGARSTNSTNVTLALYATDSLSGVTQMRFQNGGGSWGSWVAYATSYPWTLPAGDGKKTVQVQFKDGAGNVGGAQDTIILDTAAPSTCSIVINADAPYTNLQKVTLSLHAEDGTSGVKLVRFRRYNLQTEIPWGNWLTYATTKTIFLLPKDGRQWVDAQFKDDAGNISLPVTDTIVLDRTAPTAGTLKAVGGIKKVTLSWSGFNDTVSGIKSYMIYFSIQPFTERTESTKIYEGLGLSFTHTNLSPHTIYYYRAYAKDNAENISAGVPANATTY